MFALTQEEIGKLYAGLEAYRPEVVLARTLAGTALPALCMNLPEPPAPGERNPEYAAKMREILEKHGFPPLDRPQLEPLVDFATGRIPESRTGVAPRNNFV